VWEGLGSLGSGVGGLLGNTADVLASDQIDVARCAPTGAPGVLHNPVVGSVTNSEDGMVKGLSTTTVVNTAGIGLPVR